MKASFDEYMANPGVLRMAFANPKTINKQRRNGAKEKYNG